MRVNIKMRVAIIIVNYKTPELVIECLNSLRGEESDNLEISVFVGDADSGDGSVQRIQNHIAREDMTEWALCFDIGTNGGFAYGNNAIFRTHVAPNPNIDYVHFLNPDTYIRPGAVRTLVDFLKENRAVGVAGSRLENPDGSLRAFAFHFPTPWREFFRGARVGAFDNFLPHARISIPSVKTSRPVDWVSGASFMMPRSIVDQVGLMDERYFLYFEETDLMARVASAGYEVWHVSESRVVHLAGQSTGIRSGDPGSPKRLSPIWLRSRALFMRRYGRIGLALANTLFLSGDLLYRALCLIRCRAIIDPPFMWRDYLAIGRSEKSAGTHTHISDLP